MDTESHPSLEELERWIAGDPGSSAIGEHLERCPACRRTLEEVRDNAALLADIRAVDTDLAADLGYAASDAVPGYEIMGEIHRGGQGVVYRARQIATRRIVALKVLLEGAFASEERKQRFEREVEIVAGLRHANIVTVYDSGTLTDGRLYYAMEYVEGQPIDVYVRERSLSVSDVLHLFEKVCSAVRHAHQRGVIHRDLKPGNVLVDANGEPRVLDFGIAKPVELDPEAAGPGLTGTHEFLGTLAYASPEQVAGDPQDIDVRTDVYSLGVMLFEALTRKAPYGGSGSMAEHVRAIVDQLPDPPSVVRARATGKRGGIGSDLDTIVLRALAKERARRYQSAGDLGADIARYRTGDPIDARRDSTWYVLRKTAQRHKVPVAGVALFLVMILTSVIGLTRLWRKSLHAAERATDQAERATNAKDLFVGMLGATHPNRARGKDVTVREVLDEAVVRLDVELAQKPDLRAEMRTTLAEAYWSIGAFGDAEEHLTRALDERRELHGPDHLAVAESLQKLGRLYVQTEHYEDAETRLAEASDVFEALGIEAHEQVATTLADRAMLDLLRGDADAAEALLGEAIEMRRRIGGTGDSQVAEDLHYLGCVLLERREFRAAAEKLSAAVLARRQLGQTLHVGLASNLMNLGEALFNDARHAEAADAFREAHEIHAALWGADHVYTAGSLAKWALASLLGGDADGARELAERAYEKHELIERHHSEPAADALNTLGDLALKLGDHARAEAFFRASLERSEGAGATTAANLGSLLYRQRRYDEAESFCRQALETWRTRSTEPSFAWTFTLYTLGCVRYSQRDFEESGELFRECLALPRPFDGDAHPTIVEALHMLSMVHASLGEGQKAQDLLERALPLKRQLFGDADVRTLRNIHHLGLQLARNGKPEEAVPFLEEALAAYRLRLPPTHKTITALEQGLERALATGH